MSRARCPSCGSCAPAATAGSERVPGVRDPRGISGSCTNTFPVAGRGPRSREWAPGFTTPGRSRVGWGQTVAVLAHAVTVRSPFPVAGRDHCRYRVGDPCQSVVWPGPAAFPWLAHGWQQKSRLVAEKCCQSGWPAVGSRADEYRLGGLVALRLRDIKATEPPTTGTRKAANQLEWPIYATTLITLQIQRPSSAAASRQAKTPWVRSDRRSAAARSGPSRVTAPQDDQRHRHHHRRGRQQGHDQRGRAAGAPAAA